MTYYLTVALMFAFSVYAGIEIRRSRDNRRKMFLLIGMFLMIYIFWAVFVISYFL